RLRAVAARIARYAGDDAELRAIVAELEGQERRFAAPMAELARKEAWTESSYLRRARTTAGAALRHQA
ncbi:MAG TPA: hypothetical protein VF763_12245, partial [Candidatus Limnocylindrales bacterium]